MAIFASTFDLRPTLQKSHLCVTPGQPRNPETGGFSATLRFDGNTIGFSVDLTVRQQGARNGLSR
ncbi:hypothetical protein [Mesorhizobium sp. LCM 4577]|uniref:hypothetical protein n=1 Tax=Mesorhizobium sp. LCM 4577 TaxID=1848288 RepID=UPI0010427AB0|nr:hypothetical protein [Mesorhizobium sp. LCM 4577]